MRREPSAEKEEEIEEEEEFLALLAMEEPDDSRPMEIPVKTHTK